LEALPPDDTDVLNKAKYNKSSTALHLAAEYNQPAIAELLLDKGADMNLFDNNSNKPIHTAAQEGHFE
jgi:ankyrin repeat protein